MRKFSRCVLAALMLLLAGCGPKDRVAAPATGGDQAKQLSIGIVFDKGGKGDKSFNDSAARGVDRAKQEFGVQVTERLSPEDKDYEKNLGDLADKGCDLVIAVGLNMEQALAKVAKEFPQTHFAIVDGSVEAPNVRMLRFKEEEGSFLAGYVAGLSTKTKRIGFVGGMEIPLIKKFLAGYTAGAKFADKSVEVLPPKYTGNWNDAGIAKLSAQALYGTGADIVYHAAGRAGLGVFDAARESGKYAIGVDSDQDDIVPGQVLTSMIKKVDEAVYSTIKDVRDGRFTAGERIYDLKVNGVGISEMKYTKDKLDPSIPSRVEAVKAKIISGEIVVPTDEASLQTFLSSLK